jgi:pimeloyl-ACP methyl ester carboxylesterase
MPQYSLEVIHAQAKHQTESYPPVLFVHGSACGAWVWHEKFMPYFAERGCSSTAFSFRGHGHSEGREALNQFGVEDYALDLERVASTLPSAPLLIAHSLGAKVVEHFVARHPVAGVVLLAPVSPFGLATSSLSVAFGAPLLCSQLWWAQVLGPRAIDPEVVGNALFSGQLEAEQRRRYAASFQLESSRVALELTMQSYFPLFPRRLPRALIIGGDRDLLMPWFELARSAAAWGTELQVVGGANHLLMLDTCWQDVADRALAWATPAARTVAAAA